VIDTRARSSPRLSPSAIGFSGSPFVPFNPFVVPFLFSDRRSPRRKKDRRGVAKAGSALPSGMFCLVSPRSAFHITRRSESLFIDRLRFLPVLPRIHQAGFGSSYPHVNLSAWDNRELVRVRVIIKSTRERCSGNIEMLYLSSTLGSSGPGAETDTYG
jgi:hypothetical protein